jgi:arylformamidase
MNENWRAFSADDREREYSPSSCIGGNYAPYIDAYKSQSAAARSKTESIRNLAYGESSSECLDLFLPLSRLAPLLVFIHGGYWQELSKQDSVFAASECVKQDVAFAALDYTLAPEASVAQIADQCVKAIVWLKENALTLGFDPNQIFVSGSSAGAHLAAMVATRIQLQGAVLVSGIFELEPLIGTSINAALNLDVGRARAVSPQLLALGPFSPSIVCWGEIETPEFKRQSLSFSKRLKLHGVSCKTFEIPARNHFDVILDLANPKSMLGQAVLELIFGSKTQKHLPA